MLKNDGKHLIVGNRFYSTCFRKHNEYYQKIRGVRLQGQDINEEKVKQEVSIDLDGYYLLFAGYDDANHSYWTAAEKASINGMKNQIIVVIDNLGELVDAFQYGKLENDIPQRNDYPASGAKVAIAPSGDVWFMAVSPEGYDFYRVDRQW
ncbi:MAG: hypothetical protein JW881_19710 [Spirochaetales bacterium]|nr:hypothetical protein [Spirochaetales bacterium]